MLNEDFPRDYELHYDSTFGSLNDRVVFLRMSGDHAVVGGANYSVKELNAEGYTPILLEDGLYNYSNGVWMYNRVVERRYKKATNPRDRFVCLTANRIREGEIELTESVVRVCREGSHVPFKDAVDALENGRTFGRTISRKFALLYNDFTNVVYLYLYNRRVGFLEKGSVNIKHFPELREELGLLGVACHE